MSPIMMEVIEWFDQTGTAIVQRYPEDGSGDIKMGAQLIVRENQAAVFFRDGQALDAFGPGRHTLSTQNLPILTRLLSLPWGFQSPFRAEVYFVNLKVFTNMRWGTRDPVAFKDSQLGLIRLRAFGSFTMRVTQPLLFVNSLVGTQGSYTTDQIEDYLREVIVARLNDFLGETVQSLLELPRQYDEMAVALKTRLAEEFRKYGTEMVDFYINRITPPEDVERMIDERSSMGAVGDLDRFLKFKAAKAMGDAAQGHGGGLDGVAAAGVGVGVGAGLGMMMPGMLAKSLGADLAGAAVATTVSCPGCQSAVAADSRFCPRCGRQIATAARCARCQAELPTGARFCSACGQAVPGAERRHSAPAAFFDDVSMSQVVVSTECPTCSGPLDFSEGANAIRCPSCGSNLLVTGRKQVLSYWVAPKVKAEVAGAVARTGRLEARVAGARLFFVPFYRLTGHDFQWLDVPPKPEPESAAFPTVGESLGGGEPDRPEIEIPIGAMLGWGADVLLGRKAGDTVRDLLGEPPTPERPLDLAVLTAMRAAPSRSGPDGQVQFLDRYVEKTFPAADLADLGVASLGVRAQVLRVSLFERAPLAALGTIVAPQLARERAMAQGLSARGFEHVVYRQVLGRILSVIYFPFWVVELAKGGERWLTVVDAVAESVVQPRAPLSLRDALERPASDEPRTVGLRPLVCPNCGWALPAEPDDVIFFCGSCHRAWQIHGVELGDMPHEIADTRPDAANPGPAADAIYLPFWQLDAASAADAPRAWAPAFRYRRLKALHDLAARLTSKPPAYRPWTGERPAAHGCFYDAEDAALLARFAAAGRRRTPRDVKAAAEAEPAFTGARLTWLPFRREARSLIDPSTGLALQEGLLG